VDYGPKATAGQRPVGRLIYTYLYNDKENTRFIPVLLPGAKEADIPRPLRNTTRYQLHVLDLKDAQHEALYRELTHQPATTKPALRPIVPLPTAKPGHVSSPRTSPPSSNTPPPNSSAATRNSNSSTPLGPALGHRPSPIGNPPSPLRTSDFHPRVLTFVALGGAGAGQFVAAEIAGEVTRCKDEQAHVGLILRGVHLALDAARGAEPLAVNEHVHRGDGAELSRRPAAPAACARNQEQAAAGVADSQRRRQAEAAASDSEGSSSASPTRLQGSVTAR
jgi:hypothetical protein